MPSVDPGPDEDEEVAVENRRRGLRAALAGLSWRSAVLVGSLGIALAGWLPLLVICALGWAADPRIGFGSVLTVSTRFWLLANGVPAHLGRGLLTLVPLGLTALIVLMVWRLSRAIARRVADELIEGPVRARRQSDLRALSCRLALWFGGSYALLLGIATVLAGQSAELGRALVCGALIGGLCSLLASGRVLGWAPVGLSQGGWSAGVLAGVELEAPHAVETADIPGDGLSEGQHGGSFTWCSARPAWMDALTIAHAQRAHAGKLP